MPRVRLEVSRIAHHDYRLGVRGRQPFHRPREHAPVDPAPAMGLVRPISARRITPALAVAIDADDPFDTRRSPTQGFAEAPGEDRPQAPDLLDRQAKKVADPGLLAEPESTRASHIDASLP